MFDGLEPVEQPAPAAKFAGLEPIPQKNGTSPMLGRGVGEAAANLVSGAVAMPIAGIAGLVTGNTANVGKVEKALTYEPRTKEGKQIAEVVNYPFQKLAEVADTAGEKIRQIVEEETGSKQAGVYAATAINTAIQSAPMLLGLKGKGEVKAGEVAAEKPKPVAPTVGSPVAKQQFFKEIDRVAQNSSPAAAGEFMQNIGNLFPMDKQITWADMAAKAKEHADSLEQPKAPVPDTTVNMMAGVSPAEAIKSIKEGYSPFVGVKVPEPKLAPIGDSLRKIFAPASRSAEALETAGIHRANLGKMAQDQERAVHEAMDSAARFDKMPPEENYKFIAAMESGTKLTDPTLAKDAAAIRKSLDDSRNRIRSQGTGALESFYENYFPHIWERPEQVKSFFARRPLEGGKGFTKMRTFDTFEDGIKAGFKPLTNNPVELALLKKSEMDKFYYGHQIFNEMKDSGIAKFVRFGDRAPEGWVPLNDKIAQVWQHSDTEGGFIQRGKYYAPEPAALIFNNNLSPGILGNGVVDAVRKAGNMMNSLQLGLSAFHLGFTTLDASISKAALGIKQASRGDLLKGGANIAQAFNPLQPIQNLVKGDKLLKAYLGDLKDPSLAPIVEAMTDAGGRISMPEIYRNTTINGFKQALRTGRYGDAALKVLPTIMDRIAAPIFQYLVPRQKLGVFFDMAKDALEQKPDMTVKQKREVFGRLWDSVDNRMGELVYDNLFWNRTLKDSMMLSMRSVGWNLGTFRELGGGIADTGKILANKGLTDRTAYVVALPFMTGVLGSVLNYLYTGEAPKDSKDMIFPRTGRKRPDGSDDRLSLPSYMKDVYEYRNDLSGWRKYGSDPFRTVENKLHPLVSTMFQMMKNQDFYGGQIRNPQAPVVEQFQDEVNYLVKQIEPFSLRNYQQQAQTKKEEQSIGGYLTSPSMIGITPAPGYVTKSKEQEESTAVYANRDAVMKRARQELKDGADRDEVKKRMKRSGLNDREIATVMNSTRDYKKPSKLRSYPAEE